MKYLIIFSLFLWANMAKGQDLIYSQFYTAPIQLNPAFTGIVAAPVVSLNYRNQWPNIPDAYHSLSASYSQYIPDMNSSIGLSLQSDIAGGGIYNSVKIGLSYAYDIRFDDNFYIRMGLEGSFVNQRLNWNKLVFLDQLDLVHGAFNGAGVANPSQELPAYQSHNYFDVATGILLNSKYFYIGFAAKHINTPQEFLVKSTADGSNDIPVSFNFQLGSEFQLAKSNKNKNKTFLSPNILLVKQQEFYQLNLGASLKHGIFLGGIWFRHNFTNSDAVIMVLGVQKGILKVGYSFDLPISMWNIQTGGAHEISLLFNLENKTATFKNRYNDCLSLFR